MGYIVCTTVSSLDVRVVIYVVSALGIFLTDLLTSYIACPPVLLESFAWRNKGCRLDISAGDTRGVGDRGAGLERGGLAAQLLNDRGERLRVHARLGQPHEHSEGRTVEAGVEQLRDVKEDCSRAKKASTGGERA